jgi:superfamily I DNA/RNA helicase
VQSSKGLEFRSVIFIGLGQIESSETQADQNMKLLYVGMTRAKEYLLITASAENKFPRKTFVDDWDCLRRSRGKKAKLAELFAS